MAFGEETQVIPFRVDIRFSKEERKSLQAASDEWYRWTRGKLLFQLEFDLDDVLDLDAQAEGSLIIRADLNHHIIQNCCASYKEKEIFGAYKDWSIYLVPDVMYNPIFLKTTAIHEIGHYYGLDHTSKWNGVMSYHNRFQEELTIYDAIEFSRVQGTTLDEFDCGEILEIETGEGLSKP